MHYTLYTQAQTETLLLYHTNGTGRADTAKVPTWKKNSAESQ